MEDRILERLHAHCPDGCHQDPETNGYALQPAPPRRPDAQREERRLRILVARAEAPSQFTPLSSAHRLPTSRGRFNGAHVISVRRMDSDRRTHFDLPTQPHGRRLTRLRLGALQTANLLGTSCAEGRRWPATHSTDLLTQPHGRRLTRLRLGASQTANLLGTSCAEGPLTPQQPRAHHTTHQSRKEPSGGPASQPPPAFPFLSPLCLGIH